MRFPLSIVGTPWTTIIAGFRCRIRRCAKVYARVRRNGGDRRQAPSPGTESVKRRRILEPHCSPEVPVPIAEERQIMKTYRMRGFASLLMIAAALSVRLLSGTASAVDLNEPARAATEPGRVLQVGSTRLLRSPSAAAAIARDGDTIEIEAEEYRGDVAVWSRDRITIRAVGGRARLVAAGASAEGKTRGRRFG